MTRLLFWGDLGATGFGTVTTDLGRALLERDVDVRFVSFNEDGHLLDEPFRSRTLVLGGRDGWLGPIPEFHTAKEAETWASFRRDSIRGLFEALPDGWSPEATLIVGDPASLQRSGIHELVPDALPALHYVPIEGVGLPPAWAALWRKVRPVAMCEFGAGELEKLTGARPPVVYHGVNSDTFYPASRSKPIIRPDRTEWITSKTEAKRHLGIPAEAIVLFRADRFMPRKRFGAMLRSVARVMMRDPRVILLLHCRTIDEGGNLADLVSHLPPQLAARIHSTGIADAGAVADRGLLNCFYNAADIYVSTGAEGFGLTIAEALAAGTPAIGLDYSSVPEVIGDAGLVVPVGYHVENEYAYWWANPDEAKYAEALGRLVRDEGKRRLLGARGPRHVARFSWAEAARQFEELLTAPALEVAA